MHRIEMLRAQLSPGEEERLIRSLQAILQAVDRSMPPVVGVRLWRHVTFATDFCVIINCENSSKEDSQVLSLLGQQVVEVMRASGLVSIDVWREASDRSSACQVGL